MEIKRVTVIGAGTMGAGITSAVISAGFKVTVIDISEEMLDKGKKNIEKILSRGVEKGKMTPEEGAEELANYCYCGIFNHIRCAEIIRNSTESKAQNEKP